MGYWNGPENWQICELNQNLVVHKNCKKLQKIAKNLEKRLKNAYFERFWPILPGNTGTLRAQPHVQNSRAKRRTHVHSARAAAHNARAQPHAAQLRCAPAQGRIRVKDLRAKQAYIRARAFLVGFTK